ncbi:hypothetical protein Tco_0783903, partial [Tanacetum coccineum]
DYRDEKIDIKINELKENFNGMSIEINKKKKLQQLEQVASPSRFINSFCYDDDDDDDEEYTIAITPVLPTEKPDNSLSMGDEYLSTIWKRNRMNMCDVPFCDNSPPLDVLNDHFEILSDFNDDCTSSDEDSFEYIDYVEASPPDSELVSLEEVKDDILHEKLLNIYILIAKIESLNDNPTPDCMLKSPSTFPIPVEDSDAFFKKSDTSLSYSDNS